MGKVGTPRAVDPEARFWSKVKVAEGDGCWEWAGSLTMGGYGDLNLTLASERLAHRFAYRLVHGPIPAGSVVRHECDNPRCVRVSHLRLGSQADNIADKVDRGRQAKGARNGSAKLTDEQYAEMVARVSDGERQVDIARSLGVTPQAVSQYLKRRELTA